jgi:hypothetical protein
MECAMPDTDDQGRGRRGDDIPSRIASLGIIIGGPAMRPAANDNRPRPEPEAIGSSSDRDEAASD